MGRGRGKIDRENKEKVKLLVVQPLEHSVNKNILLYLSFSYPSFQMIIAFMLINPVHVSRS